MKKPAKIILGSLALLGFLSVGIFWSTGTHQGDKHNCISAAIQNEVCPNASTPEAAMFHVNTLQSLISNVLQTGQIFSALLALAFIVLIGFASLLNGLSPSPINRWSKTHPPAPPGEFRSWLAQLEHSPSFSIGRA